MMIYSSTQLKIKMGQSVPKIKIKTAFTSFVYTLGTSLYIPLTSKSNTLTLPQTRGASFTLPSNVVQSLLNVRQAELTANVKNNGSLLNDFNEKINTITSMKLPLPAYPQICSTRERREKMWDDDAYSNPSIEQLYSELETYFKVNNASSIVFAGEGEPTMRLEDMIRLAKKIRALEETKNVPIRLVTNGLCYATPLLNTERNIVLELKEAGIVSLSVALMTSSSAQYDELMHPAIPNEMLDRDVCAHQMVCDFIKRSVLNGLDVEVTGVDRSGVDKMAAQNLASDLGVVRSFRWRPFFP